METLLGTRAGQKPPYTLVLETAEFPASQPPRGPSLINDPGSTQTFRELRAIGISASTTVLFAAHRNLLAVRQSLVALPNHHGITSA